MNKNRNEYDCFNAFSSLDNRRIILFGSGRVADYYLERYGNEYAPIFIVDNNSEKWGTFKNGIEKPPNAAALLPFAPDVSISRNGKYCG